MDIPPKKRGRPPKLRVSTPAPEVGFASAVEWCLAALNNPEYDLRCKAMIAAALLKYEAERDFGSHAGGKKEGKAEAAKDAATGAYAPPPPPPLPIPPEYRLNG